MMMFGPLVHKTADAPHTGRCVAVPPVLVAELNKRLAALAFAVNLVMYLMVMATSADAVTAASFVLMLCLLLGGRGCGFLAGFLRRYLTVPIFVAVQTSGVAMLTVSTAAWMLRPAATCASGPAQLVVVFLALFLTAVGTGGLKSSVSGFGSDSGDDLFDVTGRGEESSQMTAFFNWFLFFISLGSLLGIIVLVYVQDIVNRPGGRAAAIAAALVVILADTHSMNRFNKMARTPLTHLATAAAAAARNRRVGLPADLSIMICQIEISMVAFFEEGPTNKGVTNQRQPHIERVMATGFIVTLFAVSIGIGFGGYGLVLTLLGILTGVASITVGVKMSDDPTAFCTTTFHGVSLLAVRLRRNLAVVGLVVASTAITAITGESSPGICFDLFAALLVGIALIIAGVLGA